MTGMGDGARVPALDRATHHSGPYRAGSATFALACDDPTLLARLDSDLRDLRWDGSSGDSTMGPPTVMSITRRDPPSQTHPWDVSCDGEIQQTVTEDYVRPYVLWEVTRLLLEATEPTLAIHAGSVALDGHAVVIAGVSHAGKSTLSGWLVAHGWGFLTDEVSRVELSGEGWLVHPFPRPIGVRRPTPLEPFVQSEFGSASEILVPASTLGSLAETARLEAIVLPERGAGLVPGLRPAHPATAARLLAEHLPKRASDGRAGFRALVDLVQDVPIYSLGVDDLGHAERTLRALVTGGSS